MLFPSKSKAEFPDEANSSRRAGNLLNSGPDEAAAL
jgi:hypothetical protein